MNIDLNGGSENLKGTAGAAHTLAVDSAGNPVGGPATNVANQSVPFTDTAGTSAAVNDSTTYVVITLTLADGYVVIGDDPTAATGDMFLVAYQPSRPLAVVGGTSKVSAIQDVAGGTMKIAEFSR